MIILPNYAGNKQKSFKIMKMKMFAMSDKPKPDTENIKGLIIGAVQVTRLLLWCEVLRLGHDLMY
jgi:hypothetical protein